MNSRNPKKQFSHRKAILAPDGFRVKRSVPRVPIPDSAAKKLPAAAGVGEGRVALPIAGSRHPGYGLLCGVIAGIFVAIVSVELPVARNSMRGSTIGVRATTIRIASVYPPRLII